MKEPHAKNKGIHVGTFVSEAGRRVGGQNPIAELKRMAMAGDVSAQSELGSLYVHGQGGVPRDPAAALKWLGKAAEQGLPLALGNLGYAYLMGFVGPVDAEKGLALIRQAEAAGDVQSRCHLAYAYLFGIGVPKNESSAAVLYRRAAEQGHVRAIANLADLLRNGIGVARDDAEALELARKGAGMGDPTAMIILGDMYLAGRGGVAKDETTAAGWYQSAARLGSPEAQERMGQLLESGQGVPKNTDGAVSWYEAAAANGLPGAVRRLAEMRFYGSGVPKQVLKAMEGFRRAAEQGDAVAARTMGNLAVTGCAVMTHNPTQAVRWFSQAAEAGDAMARFLLGEAYENGDGVAADPAEAERWFRLAAEQGHRGAERALLTPHPPLFPVSLKAMPQQDRDFWLRARNGDAARMVWLGGRFMKGKDGFPKSEQEALRWFELASAAGDKMAICLEASFYACGTCLPKDLEQAIRLLLPLAEEGDTVAQRELGLIYGTAGAPGKHPCLEAAKWQTLAAEKDEDPAQMNRLGNLYFSIARQGPRMRTIPPGRTPSIKGVAERMCYNLANDMGLQKNRDGFYRKALHWYQRAADKGHAEALANLGDYAFLGLAGIPKDEAEAFRFYSRASELGDRHAAVNLGTMLCEGWGCGKDVEKGLDMLRKARAAGSAMAWHVLRVADKDDQLYENLSLAEVRRMTNAAAMEFFCPAAKRRLSGFRLMKSVWVWVLVQGLVFFTVLAAAVWGLWALSLVVVRWIGALLR